MKVILFGASGMVGQGVLRECLLDTDVEAVLAIGRAKSAAADAKLREVVLPDVSDLSSLQSELGSFDACFFCLGTSAAGMSEPDYRRITYDLTLAVAKTLSKLNPAMTFVYVSGEGTDSTEKKGAMWARVKGATENALLALPFKAAYMFRPGLIRPLHGIKSRTTIYRVTYALLWPLFPIMKALTPNVMTTTEVVGRAMLIAAKRGAPKQVLATRDINALVNDFAKV